MKPRFAADYRTLVWALLMPIVACVQMTTPRLIPYLFLVGCYLALAAGVISHNHNHCPTFKNRKVNNFFANWLSVFYGYPTFAWVPTHNLNHHKFVNKAGDATITWRYTDKHNWLVASTYFFVSAYWQSDPIKTYIRKARKDARSLFRQIVSQYCIWAGAHLAAMGLCVALHGVVRGLLVYIAAMGFPAFFALWTIMFFNYIQHVHTDPWSEHNHSRSFVGKSVNFWLFNNGLHTAHHEQAGAHWSTLPRLHAQVEMHIDEALRQPSFWGFLFRSYVLSVFMPRFGTRQVGRAPYDAPNAGPISIEAGDVEAVESGVNAAMA